MLGVGDTKSSDPAGTTEQQAAFTPSLMSRRARQLQAEEGSFPAPVYKPTGIANELDPIIESSDPTRASRGRARAGTLPSSWGDALPPFQVSPSQSGQNLGGSPADSVVDLSRSILSASQADPHRFGPVSGSVTPDTARLGAQSTANQRIRSGSLTLPSPNLQNAFGPSFFSSNWQPTRSGLSNMTTTEEESSFSASALDDTAARYAFDGSETLDYLGLADVNPGIPSANFGPDFSSPSQAFLDQQAYLSSSSFRNRASTLSSQLYRPKLSAGDGRARSSSFLPSIRLDPVEDASRDYITPQHPPRSGTLSGSQTPSVPGHQPSLFTAALQNRLSQYHNTQATDLAGLIDNSVLGGPRPRATSMGVLDRHQRGAPTDQNLAPNRTSASDFRPAGLDSAARTSPLHTSSQVADADMAILTGGRHRAGTIAAFSGPGGRQRTEQELLRMTQMLPENVHHQSRPARPSSSGVLDSGRNYETLGRRASPKHSVPGSGSTSPYSQPTRTLWVGNLRRTVSSQDLLHIFSHYGAVETVRLVPDKGCAFINYIDLNDAMLAKDDLTNRLGGRLGLGTMGPDGAVRIGFGKPDSIPPATISGAPSFPNDAVTTSTTSDVGGGNPPGDFVHFVSTNPTRALWVGLNSSNTTSDALLSVFSPFGPIESVRVLSSKYCGFVNFERLDDAVLARKVLHNRDFLGPEVGPVRVGFAKVPSPSSNGFMAAFDPTSKEFQAAMEDLTALQGASAVPADVQLRSGNLENFRSNLALDLVRRHSSQSSTPTSQTATTRNLYNTDATRLASANAASSRVAGFPTHSSSNSIVPSSDKGGVPLPAEMKPKATTTDLQMLMRELDDSDPNLAHDIELVAKPRTLSSYYTRIPTVSELPPGKRFDNARLKELRKRIENPSCSQNEIDSMARDCLPGIVDLSSDFIGNTLVQKFFERCSEPMKGAMLELIAPHLAMIGIHKNGTWAAQKIIDCTRAEDQRALITQHVRPYVPPLLLNEYGNYVVQRLFPFGSPYCDFIFDAMVDRCWEIAQGRYGARSMRTCLESPTIPRSQMKRVAIAIILNAVPLATSQNGALLVAQLLEANTLPGRFRLLAPRMTPHLANLCTHKLASQTVFRIISQKTDPEASHQILRVLFDPHRPELLEEILTDQVHGSQFITKLLVDPTLLDVAQRDLFAGKIKDMLVRHNLVSMPAYRPLCISLGLLAPDISSPPPSSSFTGNAADGFFKAGYHSGSAGFEHQFSSLSIAGAGPGTSSIDVPTSSATFAPFGPSISSMIPSPSSNDAMPSAGGATFASRTSAFDPWATEDTRIGQNGGPGIGPFGAPHHTAAPGFGPGSVHSALPTPGNGFPFGAASQHSGFLNRSNTLGHSPGSHRG